MLFKKNMDCTSNNIKKLTKYVKHVNPVHIIAN